MEPRKLPSVDALSRMLPASLPAALRVAIARSSVAAARDDTRIDPRAHALDSARKLDAGRQRRVINATGVILHTNLGRAPLEPKAGARLAEAATGYTNLELALDSGQRGGRTSYVTELLTTITGAEDALVVNNNAAALFLILMAMATGRSVPVSRGELIEIGGSYRLPDLMAATGTRLVEVGTTNRTRISDYEAALDDTSALLLKVHPSNYRIEGFAEEADIASIAGLAHARGLPAVFDVGSGLVDERTPWLAGPPPSWLASEPGVVQALESGADLVTFSGDKLLGGPQAGIVVGHAQLIGGLRRHPVTRALRLDGPTLAALEATLERYADGTAATLPLWQMATADGDHLRARAEAIAASLPHAVVVDGASTIGAGSVPGSEIPGPVIRLPRLGEMAYVKLLAMDPPVVARREAGDLLVDLRTVDPADDDLVRSLLEQACRS